VMKQLIVGIPKETFPGETRVAVIPAVVPILKKAGLDVLIESSAGVSAGFTDSQYQEKSAEISDNREKIFERSQIILSVRFAGANPKNDEVDGPLMERGQVIIGFMDPFGPPENVKRLAIRNVTSFAMELIPRISRAQSMDALSSMATVAGYKAVLLAAGYLPKMFPMLMTAAGTVAPAKVFVIGAGVAGLQAIATAKRLGAVVHAYDLRPAVKEQVQSLGAKFVELAVDSKESEDKSGYAKEMGEDFYKRQREMMEKVVAESDVVIATAAVPGKKAPILITKDMVAKMALGSVIVDLAAERGGNCELTRLDEVTRTENVTILGPSNLATSAPYHASQMYAKNITTFLLSMIKDGVLNIDLSDEVIRETLVTKDGEVVNDKVKEFLSS